MIAQDNSEGGGSALDRFHLQERRSCHLFRKSAFDCNRRSLHQRPSVSLILGTTNSTGRFRSTTIFPLQSVPLKIPIGGPKGEDHRYPLLVFGSRNRSAVTSIGDPARESSLTSCSFRKTRSMPSGVLGNNETPVTLPRINPYSSGLTVDGAIWISMSLRTFLPSPAGI